MTTTREARGADIPAVDGWLTDAQAAMLADAAAACPPDGEIVEIGSFRGKSTIVLAKSAPEGAAIVAIDPHAGTDRGPQEIAGYADEAASVYIDGAHRYRPARADIRDWGSRVAEGGTMLIHDSFSSVGVTMAIVRELMFGGRFRYVGRSRSLTQYRADLTGRPRRARMRNAARQAAELPWFVRNVGLKVLLSAGLGRVLGRLGHSAPEWPY